jgi:hypothetical protein
MPRFSLKDLLLMLTLLPVGAVLAYSSLGLPYYGFVGATLGFFAWLFGGAAIGAAALIPFNKPWLGASLGMMAAFLWLGVLVVLSGLS